MNKKFIFLIILTLFIGLLLGYTGEYLANSTSMASIPTDKEKSPTSHRFGDSRDGPKIDVSRKETSRKIKNTQLNKQDEKLLRLTQMSQAEMQREMAKICQKAISPSHLNAQDQLAFAFLCSRLGQKAPLQILEQMDGGAKYNARFKKYILDVWANRNPEAAKAYCLDDKNPQDPFSYARIITQSAPDTAFEWINGLAIEKKFFALRAFFQESAKFHPERLGEFIEKTANFNTPRGVQADILKEWGKIDKESTLKWINTLPVEQQIVARASALSELPLDEATRELGALKGKAKATAIAEIANTLAKKSGEQAIAWVIQNADSNPKSLAKITSSLKFPDFDSSMQDYLDKMPKGEMKDTFMSEAVNRWFDESNESSLHDLKMEDVLVFASKIGDKEKRENSTDNALHQWIGKDPEKAFQWMEKSDLSPDRKRTQRDFYQWKMETTYADE